MSQDNNESPSAAVVAFKAAFHDAHRRYKSYDEAVAAGLAAVEAASASQSSTAGAAKGWFLNKEFLSEPAANSLDKLIERAKHAHMCDVDVRINGKNERFEADWIKYMVPSLDAPVPRVGGPDETKPESSDLAHVARQRQESAPNGIKATMRHDAGAMARCSYCGRYSLDPATLSDRQPVCECGKQHGWSGSFVAPDANSKWSGKAPAPSAAVAEGVDTAPADFLMPEDAWNEYATRSGLLNEHGVAPQPATTQAAYFAYIAAWNRLHAAFSAYVVTNGAQQREAGRREEPMRKHVEAFAAKGGWSEESGEGAFEFVQRISYEQGFADRGRSEYDSTLRARIAELESALAERDATALRVAQCAGEFARGAALSRQPVSEGLTQAIAFIEKRAEDYINEHASTESDTGATVWHFGEAGCDYHSSLVELADDLRALSAVPPAKAEGVSSAPTWEDFRHSLAILMCSLSGRALESCERLLDEVSTEQPGPIAAVRASLTQQAKKGNQQ